MKVLMISGDKNILIPGSGAYARVQLQKATVDQLDVFVWPQVHSRRDMRIAARKENYDVITAQDPFWRGHFAWNLARRHGAKLNLQVHTDLSAYSWPKRVFAQFHLRRADSVRVVSEKLRSQVKEMGVVAPIHLLPIFVDVEKFHSVSPKPHAQKTILWVGRFEKEKDPLSAIEVLEAVRHGGVDAKLVMVGAGSLDQQVRRRAADLPVEIMGWHDDILPYMEVADVVLSTSQHESWGASMVEALAAGVPVVAPDVGIAKEAGAIVVPRSELASAIIRVLPSGERGLLKLKMLSEIEWASAWKETLI